WSRTCSKQRRRTSPKVHPSLPWSTLLRSSSNSRLPRPMRDIKTGMAAEITLGGRIQPGIVTAISPQGRQSQVTGRVRFAAEQPPGLRQNERASVRIVLDERDRVLNFERGPLIDESTSTVYVVRGNHAVRTPVQLGAASVGEIEALHGLAAG